jgi:hypothetical protein
MASVRFKRGTTAQNLAYIGPAGSLTLDTELKQLRLHDGLTPGGKVLNDPAVGLSNGVENYLVNGDFRHWWRGTEQANVHDYQSATTSVP